jgi:hypothetical protein
MKKILTLLVLAFSISIFGQAEITITQKKCIPRKGFHLQLKSVFDDSRCPEGTNCVWAGEVSAIINVFNNKKIVEEKTIVFNFKKLEENKKWFQNYYSKKIKDIQVLPYPKEGVEIKSKNYFIQITFLE